MAREDEQQRETWGKEPVEGHAFPLGRPHVECGGRGARLEADSRWFVAVAERDAGSLEGSLETLEPHEHPPVRPQQ